jgi:diketogulonate reductase-like aldo/keto reductase
VAAGQALGLGITAWSPLAGGFLTGKYGSTGGSVAGEGRLSLTDLPQTDWTDRDWELLNTVRMVAGRVGTTMAQVTLNWVATQPGIASAIVGASSPDQLESALAALDFELPAELRALLDEASAGQGRLQAGALLLRGEPAQQRIRLVQGVTQMAVRTGGLVDDRAALHGGNHGRGELSDRRVCA